MNDKKINIKLLNVLIVISIVCLLYLIKDLWVGAFNQVIAIIWPFIVAFAIAYALFPYKKKLEEKGLPTWLSILIVTVCSIGLFIVLIILVIPLLYEQALLFMSSMSTFLADIASKYGLDLGTLQDTLSKVSSQIFGSISNGAIGFINASLGVLASFVIIIFVAIYILIDMDKVRSWIKGLIRKKKTFNYVKQLDIEVTNYFVGFLRNMLIQFVEYTFVFFIIGHPNFLILGLLASVSNIIPYFGGFIVNIFALIIASVISPQLTILTLVVCLICPQLDSYVIAPKIYGKTNNIHPLINIFAVFAGGILFGFWGILIALPLTIIILTTYKFYKKDIDEKLNDIKEKV